MALIKCPECGKDISDKAKACPNCGLPIEEISIKNDTEFREEDIEKYFEEAEIEETNTSDSSNYQRPKNNVLRVCLGILAAIVVGVVVYGIYTNSDSYQHKRARELREDYENSMEEVNELQDQIDENNERIRELEGE